MFSLKSPDGKLTHGLLSTFQDLQRKFSPPLTTLEGFLWSLWIRLPRAFLKTSSVEVKERRRITAKAAQSIILVN